MLKHLVSTRVRNPFAVAINDQVVQNRIKSISIAQSGSATIALLTEAETGMPQIWMTYEEAGEVLDCSAFEARAHALQQDWVRKRSRDGQTRLKLPSAVVEAYLERYFQARLQRMLASSLPVRQMQTMIADIDLKRSEAA